MLERETLEEKLRQREEARDKNRLGMKKKKHTNRMRVYETSE